MRRIMRKFKIDHIAAVDKPAVEGAVMTIMKRNDSERDFVAELNKSHREGRIRCNLAGFD